MLQGQNGELRKSKNVAEDQWILSLLAHLRQSLPRAVEVARAQPITSYPDTLRQAYAPAHYVFASATVRAHAAKKSSRSCDSGAARQIWKACHIFPRFWFSEVAARLGKELKFFKKDVADRLTTFLLYASNTFSWRIGPRTLLSGIKVLFWASLCPLLVVVVERERELTIFGAETFKRAKVVAPSNFVRM